MEKSVSTGVPALPRDMCLSRYLRGLGFKLVDFLCKRSDVCHTEIKML